MLVMRCRNGQTRIILKGKIVVIYYYLTVHLGCNCTGQFRVKIRLKILIRKVCVCWPMMLCCSSVCPWTVSGHCQGCTCHGGSARMWLGYRKGVGTLVDSRWQSWCPCSICLYIYTGATGRFDYAVVGCGVNRYSINACMHFSIIKSIISESDVILLLYNQYVHSWYHALSLQSTSILAMVLL